MSLAERVPDDLKAAMKAGDRVRTSVLRMLHAALKNERIAKRGELEESDAIGVVQREVKRRRDAAEQYRKGGAEDRARAEEAEAELLATYLPAALSEEEVDAAIDAIIAESGAESKRDLGKVMGPLMARFKGRIDGNVARQKVLAKLG